MEAVGKAGGVKVAVELAKREGTGERAAMGVTVLAMVVVSTALEGEVLLEKVETVVEAEQGRTAWG